MPPEKSVVFSQKARGHRGFGQGKEEGAGLAASHLPLRALLAIARVAWDAPGKGRQGMWGCRKRTSPLLGDLGPHSASWQPSDHASPTLGL